MNKKIKQPKGRLGFTLVEVLLTISIMTVALTGINLLVTNGLRSLVDAKDRSIGSEVVQSVLSSILSGDYASFSQEREFPCESPHENWYWKWSLSSGEEDGIGQLRVEATYRSGQRPSRIVSEINQLVDLQKFDPDTRSDSRRRS